MWSVMKIPLFTIDRLQISLTHSIVVKLHCCRFVKDNVLWACLAGMSVHAKHLDTAEVAYAAIQEADKVYYIQYIKELPLKEARAAEMSVMTGHYQVLLHWPKNSLH